MKIYRNILEAFKSGIQPFVDVTVKLHHEKLLGSIPGPSASGFTRPESCSLCNKRNLNPRHPGDECPSRNSCPCKTKGREKRPCPKGICDYIYEEIIKDHYNYSPNLKNTNIGQWTQNYWEIAMCYMKHHSNSAECTDIIDMLHLVVNNRIILQKLLHPEPATPEEADKIDTQLSEFEVRSIVHKIIKVCTRLKRPEGKCNVDDIKHLEKLLDLIGDKHALQAKTKFTEIEGNISGFDKPTQNKEGKPAAEGYISSDVRGDMTLSLTDKKIYEDISNYIRSADNALYCRRRENELVSLQICTEQRVDIYGQYEEVLGQSLTAMEFGEKIPRKYIVTKADENGYRKSRDSSRWDEYEWLIYNLLKRFDSSRKKGENEGEYRLPVQQADTYSKIYVVSKAFSNRAELPLQTFSEYVLTQAKLENKQCLLILDCRDPTVLQVFEDDSDTFEKHTVIKIVNEVSNIEKEISSSIVLRLHPVGELTIRGEDAGKIKNKRCAEQIQKCLYKCMTKIGRENISKLTFENIRFVTPSTKLKISFISKLKTLKVKSCNFTPCLPSSLVFLEVEESERKLSHYLNQLNVVFPTTVQTCHSLKYLRSAEIKIGSKEFCIKLSKSVLETSAMKYYGKTLTECDDEEALELLHDEISKILHSTNCNFKDFEQAEEDEKKAILRSMCYGLRELDQNFVHVYAAVYAKNESRKIVLVCYMRENFDFDEEGAWGKYRGFSTFKKSYNNVYLDHSDKINESIDENKLNDYFQNKYELVNETIREHAEQLMKDHSNLEVIGIHFGETNDPGDDPYIALYVRSKSFVPFGENPFPSELTHPSDKEISFRTVVLEDYFIPSADAEAAAFKAWQRVPYLVMGCSIGLEGNKNGASLGPFVEFEMNGEKKTGFLTVCHLFSLPEDAQCVSVIGTKVVQPCEDDDFVDTKQQYQETSTSSVCGRTVAYVYDDTVDASLVLITDRAPDKGRFISCTRGDLREAGFSDEHVMPRYKDGSSVDLSKCIEKYVVKFSKTTNLTTGRCIISQGAVRVNNFDIDVTCPHTLEKRTHYIKEQFQIRAIGRNRFSDYGDSGAGIFLVNNDKSLSCIGMVIGQTERERTCIATPIAAVLDKLSREHRGCITLKKFPE